METESLNYSQSDYSEASVASLGRSTAMDVDSELSPLLDSSSQVRQSDPITGTSWYVSIFLVVNAALGAGLLNFPAAYHHCGGIVVAVSVQASLAVFVIGSTLILVYCAEVYKSATYQDVVFSACGRCVHVLCSIALAVYSFGTCITFFIIIADQWDKFLSLVYDTNFCDFWYMNRRFTLSITAVLFVLPMCFPRRIDFLKYASILGTVAVLYCVALVTIKYFTSDFDTVNCYVAKSPDTWMDVFTVIPVICFGYQCHLSLVPIYICTCERRVSTFMKTIIIALAICCLSYTVTASFGYLTFGSCVKADILLSYRPTADVLVAVIIIAIKMYTTYPILLFVGRAAVDSVLLDIGRNSMLMTPNYERPRRIILTLIWFIASLMLAIFIPNIGLVISLLGGLAGIFIFIFPGLCLLQLLLQGYLCVSLCWPKYSIYIIMSATCLVLGSFIFGLTTTQSLIKDFADLSKHLEPIGRNSSDHCILDNG